MQALCWRRIYSGDGRFSRELFNLHQIHPTVMQKPCSGMVMEYNLSARGMRTKTFKQRYGTNSGHWKHAISSHNRCGHSEHMSSPVPHISRETLTYQCWSWPKKLDSVCESDRDGPNASCPQRWCKSFVFDTCFQVNLHADRDEHKGLCTFLFPWPDDQLSSR